MDPNKEAAAHGHPPPNIKLYMGIFAALLCLTVLTVTVSHWDLPATARIPVGLAIACVKAGLVAAFFMHLKGEKALIWACLGIMAFCTIGFFLIPLDMHMIGDRTTHTPVIAGEAAEAPEAAKPAEEAKPAETPKPAAKPAKAKAKGKKK